MKKISFIFIGLMVMALTSCIRPYDRQEYVDIETNETAFVIPLFADDSLSTSDQVVVNSEAYYQHNKLNEKLVQIPHKWKKTGRFANSGEWIPALKVVAVSNSPVSITWENEIKVETKGSQGFTVPMKGSIRVEPQNAAKFLSKFPANYQVQDKENDKKVIRSKMVSSVQRVANDQFKNAVATELSIEFHKYEYKDVMPNRDIIVNAALERVKTWAENYGITIDNLAVWNGLIPDDATLQTEMDNQAKLAAQVETEKKRQDAQAQMKRNEIEMAKLEKEKIEVERANVEAKARMTVSEQQILAQTSKLELDRKQREQEIENLRLRGKAEADAIRTKADKFAMPNTLIVTPEFSNALGLGEVLKQ